MKIKSMMMAVLLSAELLAGAAHASMPSDASIERYMQLMNFEQDFAESFAFGFTQPAKVGLFDYIKKQYPDATAEQLTQMDKAADKVFGDRARQIANHPKVRNMVHQQIADVIKRNYTQEEIDALNDFYGTPVGQSTVKKSMQVYQDFTKEVIAKFVLMESEIQADIGDAKADQRKLMKTMYQIFEK
ncbi:DUF2059 domain-containing protein [Moraxella marmotae]|uniref:DUF2059 domain-containing protein n=1 Tax=Moraxella marmotae TaxID=3344520 RepID=UPI0035F3BB38